MCRDELVKKYGDKVGMGCVLSRYARSELILLQHIADALRLIQCMNLHTIHLM